MCQPEGWTSETTGESAPLLVLSAGVVETAKRLERARKSGVRSIKARVELERHPVVEHRLLVLAREIVGVADTGIDHHRERIKIQRLVHRSERLGVTLVRIQSASEQIVRVRETRVQLDSPLQRAESAGEIAGVRKDGADRDVCFGERRVE